MTVHYSPLQSIHFIVSFMEKVFLKNSICYNEGNENDGQDGQLDGRLQGNWLQLMQS